MDTRNRNMLSMLSNANKSIAELIRITEEKKLEDTRTDLEEIHEQMENIIGNLPKQIYNFKKRDYAELSHRLEDLMKDLEKIFLKIEQYNTGIDGILIMVGLNKEKNEVERCIYKARSKANK